MNKIYFLLISFFIVSCDRNNINTPAADVSGVYIGLNTRTTNNIVDAQAIDTVTVFAIGNNLYAFTATNNGPDLNNDFESPYPINYCDTTAINDVFFDESDRWYRSCQFPGEPDVTITQDYFIVENEINLSITLSDQSNTVGTLIFNGVK